MTAKFRMAVFSLTCLGMLSSCGDSASQTAARDRAVQASCDRVAACGDIGVGKTYASRDACNVKLSSTWQDIWPPADCDGRIDPAMLDVCLQAINQAECNNALDLLNIFANKCAKAKICSATKDR